MISIIFRGEYRVQLPKLRSMKIFVIASLTVIGLGVAFTTFVIYAGVRGAFVKTFGFHGEFFMFSLLVLLYELLFIVPAILIIGIIPYGVIHYRRKKLLRRDECHECGYPLRVPDSQICSECGTKVPDNPIYYESEAKAADRLRRAAVRRWILFGAILPFAISWAIGCIGGEAWILLDERAFRAEVDSHIKSGNTDGYGRDRWWPGRGHTLYYDPQRGFSADC